MKQELCIFGENFIDMLGAIIGDIVGSRWEFNPTNDYNFPLFSEKNGFTDDTVCTVAVADALLNNSSDYGKYIHEWCRRYPHPKGGYGGRFVQWVRSDQPKPYNSLGNGSAMRVSPVGRWFSDSDKIAEQAKKTAECTHNHPEGIIGAQAVALAIHDCWQLAQTKKGEMISKEDILWKGLGQATKLYVDTPDLFNVDIEEHRNIFDETCPGTVPVALAIIQNSSDFEDAIRQAVSLGADADTIGAIVGSIAETLWGIPEWMKEKTITYLPDEMREVVGNFYEQIELPSRITPNRIDTLNEGEIFVFGSNKQGYHGGGAARAALNKFGAEWGNGEGLQGRSYALPTMEGLESTKAAVDRFTAFAAGHKELRFYVTAVGCGIAGYVAEEIAPFFAEAAKLENVYLPASFWEVLKG